MRRSGEGATPRSTTAKVQGEGMHFDKGCLAPAGFTFLAGKVVSFSTLIFPCPSPPTELAFFFFLFFFTQHFNSPLNLSLCLTGQEVGSFAVSLSLTHTSLPTTYYLPYTFGYQSLRDPPTSFFSRLHDMILSTNGSDIMSRLVTLSDGMIREY